MIPQVGDKPFVVDSNQQADIRLVKMQIALWALTEAHTLTIPPVIGYALDEFLTNSPMRKIASQGSTSQQTLVGSALRFLNILQLTPTWMERQLNHDFLDQVRT
jgi:hypothetical protein